MGEFIIKMPDVGEGVAEAELVEWHVKTGDPVREDMVIAAVMNRVALTFEDAERLLQDRGSELAARPVVRPEAILLAGRKADRSRLLPCLEHVHREMAGADQPGSTDCALVDVDQQQRRVE